MASLVLNIGSSNRVSVNDECISKFNDLKLGKSLKYIIYKLSDDYKEVVVEEASTDPDWENFQNKLLNAKSAWKGKEGKGPRYAVYDFQYELEGGEGLRKALNGVGADVQANNEDEIEYSTILKTVSRGKL
ncbi:MAG: hypothetical protein LQ338_006244 [Usnochroma carphineum]|nr:MAG: hypothetical protein LQ338_006244 [Usnochroma carphineum]